jgi:mannose-6-phosphate isomerase-like protein (cupin superfamily)
LTFNTHYTDWEEFTGTTLWALLLAHKGGKVRLLGREPAGAGRRFSPSLAWKTPTLDLNATKANTPSHEYSKTSDHRPTRGHVAFLHGIPSQIITAGEETLDTYTVSRGTAAPEGGAPPHSHTFDEGFYVLRGEMTFFAGNTSVQLAAGDFINIRGGTGHYPRTKAANPQSC